MDFAYWVAPNFQAGSLIIDREKPEAAASKYRNALAAEREPKFMQELGRIQTAQKIACPHCRALLEDTDLERALEGETVKCPHCGNPVKLPSDLVERYLRSKYVGRNLDITC